METSIIIAGFGGQGVLFAGQMLAYAGMDNGRFVTWFPSYGPEMRGGTANCTVMVSDQPIGAPVTPAPDIVLVLNQPSFAKYVERVKEGGLLLVNSDSVQAETTRSDIKVVKLPASQLAKDCGAAQVMNLVMVGGMLAKRPFLSLTAVQQALHDHLPANKAKLLTANIQALAAGYNHLKPSAETEKPQVQDFVHLFLMDNAEGR